MTPQTPEKILEKLLQEPMFGTQKERLREVLSQVISLRKAWFVAYGDVKHFKDLLYNAEKQAEKYIKKYNDLSNEQKQMVRIINKESMFYGKLGIIYSINEHCTNIIIDNSKPMMFTSHEFEIIKR